MFILLKKRTLYYLLGGIMLVGFSLGTINLAMHPHMYEWEKDGVLVRKINTSEKVVSLSFDDGPDPINTPAVLEVLEKYNVKATFFIVGNRAEKNPDIVLNTALAGHEIGNHSYSHGNYNNEKDDFILKDIRKGSEVIHSITGQNPCFFRPPGGYLSYAMVEQVKNEGLIIGYWTYQQDSKDWKQGSTAASISKHIQDNIGPGQIIILHDGASNGMQTARALDSLIPVLQKQGYRFVTMSELVKLQNKA